jgi:hypothetical protein
MIKLKKIALMEMGGSHEEILQPQINWLKETDYQIFLIIRSKHFKRVSLDINPENVLAIEEDYNILKRWNNLKRIVGFLKKNHITNLVINTTQGAFIRDFSLICPSINITGIAHNPQKIGKSFSQKIISKKVKKYLVLNDYILDHINRNNLSLSFNSFYPIKSFEISEHTKTDSLKVVIPGAVDMKRRDYYQIIDSQKTQLLDKNIKFIFLGKCKTEEAKLFRKEIEILLLKKQFEFFDEFIPDAKFNTILSSADLILPLITPRLDSFQLYKKYKISGAINLSFGMKIPMLMHESLKHIIDYQTSSIFYEEGKLFENLNKIIAHKEILEKKKFDIMQEKKFNLEFQKKQYLEFVLLNS